MSTATSPLRTANRHWEVNSWPAQLDEFNARFAFVFHRFYGPLIETTNRVVRCRQETEDIVMKVFLNALRSKNQPRTLRHLQHRLFVSARNEAISHLHFKIRKQMIADELRYHTQQSAYLRQPAILTPVSDQIAGPLGEELARLSRRQQKILQLYFYEGMSTRQIADELQVSPQTVLNTKTVAIQRLRDSGFKTTWLALVE